MKWITNIEIWITNDCNILIIELKIIKLATGTYFVLNEARSKKQFAPFETFSSFTSALIISLDESRFENDLIIDN